VTKTTVEEYRAAITEQGFHEIERCPDNPEIASGVRVHHRGERYLEAEMKGTATVVAVFRRGTDEAPDNWEQTYGRPNVEILVEFDQERYGTRFAYWADYGTVVARDWLTSMQERYTPTEGFVRCAFSPHEGWQCVQAEGHGGIGHLVADS